MYSFRYHAPASVSQANALFAEADDPIYIAGGMTLIPTMKQRLAQPSDVIDLAALDDLRGLTIAADCAQVGALTTHNQVAEHAELRQVLPVLAEVAAGIGDNQVRNRGTLGGSLANSDPAADYPAAVVALGATVVTNERRITADDFFVDLFETALSPNEIILRVEFPVPTRAAYAKFANPASGYAVVGVLVADFAGQIRVGVTGAGPCGFRAREIEHRLEGNLNPTALAELDVPSSGFNNDMHASAEYRAHLVRVMAQRAVARL